MSIDTSRSDDELTIMVSGDLDASSAIALDAAMDDIVAADPPARLVIDLAGLDFCDTAGVRALARAHRVASAQGAHCRLIRAQPHVAWLLRVTDTPLGTAAES
jgi:anti-anti-sigma factor